MDTKAIAADFSKQLDGFKKQHEKASAMLADVNGKIADLEGEASTLTHSQLNCEDFAAYMCEVVDEFAEEGRKNISQVINRKTGRHPSDAAGPYMMPSGFAWSAMESPEKRKAIVGHIFSALVTAFNPNMGHNFAGHFDVVSVCTLFGDQVKASLGKNLAAIEWPYPDAQPVAEREKRLAAIEVELLPLRKSEAELSEMLAQMAVLKG